MPSKYKSKAQIARENRAKKERKELMEALKATCICGDKGDACL